ncbi:hypothetical protein NE237_027773 [Protea cynaroides]|uniref:Uncharacterized protein n=1 Tax=Protea cynaroides TaxID=273540 RepID=A0A9Q0JTB6_9MAGN|nr:hypothetical protein NE237_027773 [Protea cynaroides]
MTTKQRLQEAEVSIREKMTKAVEEYKALDELKDYVAELDTLYDLKHEIATPTFWKALHLLSNYVGKTAGDDFDFFGFVFNIDAPTDSDEAEDAPNKQVEGVTDQQVEEGLVDLEEGVAIDKALEEVVGDKATATEELGTWRSPSKVRNVKLKDNGVGAVVCCKVDSVFDAGGIEAARPVARAFPFVAVTANLVATLSTIILSIVANFASSRSTAALSIVAHSVSTRLVSALSTGSI